MNAEQSRQMALFFLNAMHDKARIVGVFCENERVRVDFAFAELQGGDSGIAFNSHHDAKEFVLGFIRFNSDKKLFSVRCGFISPGYFIAGHGVSFDVFKDDCGFAVRVLSNGQWASTVMHFDDELDQKGKERAEALLAWLLADLKLQGWDGK